MSVCGSIKTSSLLLEIAGPDPKGVKARDRFFHVADDGEARFSATGLVWSLDGLDASILGPADLVLPFVQNKRPESHSNLSAYVRISGLCRDRQLKLQFGGFIEVPGLQAAIDQLCAGDVNWKWAWKLRSTKGKQQGNAQPWLALFTCTLEAGMLDVLTSHALARELPAQGTPLLCEGAPFGCLAPSHFQSYLVNGIVANQPCKDDAVVLADMHCLPGMEGAGVLMHNGLLLGLLASPLTSTRFDAEIAVVISAQHVELAFIAWQQGRQSHSLRGGAVSQANSPEQDLPKSISFPPDPDAAFRNSALGKAAASIVAVQSGDSWASGIVMSGNGLVMTNAHVLVPHNRGEAENSPQTRGCCPASSSQEKLTATPAKAERAPSLVKAGLRLPCGSLSWLPAEVIYIFTSSLDLAILRIDTQGTRCQLRPAELPDEPAQLGRVVYVVGYGLLHPRQCPHPLMSDGIISKVMEAAGSSGLQAAMIISSAAVHPGASGGGLFSREGRLLGVTTSNTSHFRSGKTFARLNYSIPSVWLREVWRTVEKTRSPQELLPALDGHNSELAALWSLKPLSKLLPSTGEDPALQRLEKLMGSLQEQSPLPNSKL